MRRLEFIEGFYNSRRNKISLIQSLTMEQAHPMIVSDAVSATSSTIVPTPQQHSRNKRKLPSSLTSTIFSNPLSVQNYREALRSVFSRVALPISASNQHYTCDICGSSGWKELLTPCCICDNSAAHIYCMDIKLEGDTKVGYMCEDCSDAASICNDVDFLFA